MAETSLHNKVIRQNDENLPKYLDFSRLRQEGLVHIGNLGGKIWTDHNTHDPGITTLEALCYALLDLGYRTQLPVEDLLAKKDGAEEDNFFTAAEILSCNPVTITDYRKLLLEIEGVRNAWLEPVEKRNPRLVMDQAGALCCCDEKDIENRVSSTGLPGTENEKEDCGCSDQTKNAGKKCIDLNGLYHVFLELEPDLYEKLEQEKKEEENCRKVCEAQCLNPTEGFLLADCVEKCREKRNVFFRQIQCVLSAHRNLCEDFEDITILCPQKIGICANVEILPGADAEKVYYNILRNLTDFVSPTARFYSLQSLLDKGAPMEEIFAGRPHSLKSIFEKGLNEHTGPDLCTQIFETSGEAVFRSFGFLDTEELENLPRKKELHLSDLYSVLQKVEGVRSIRDLCINSDPTGSQTQGSPDADCSNEALPQIKWRFQLLKDRAPVFVFDDAEPGTPLTNIQLFTTTGTIPINKKKIHAQLTGYRKSRLSDEFLDTAIPSGFLREDLSDYVSVQNDFPRVYGIGETGLPESASLLRQVQAYQLQGYLLFFDQLLADYLHQLSHLRDLFSLQQESLRPQSVRHTSFSFPLDAEKTPGLERLIRSYSAQIQGIPDGAVLAVPVNNNEILEEALCQVAETLKGNLVVNLANSCFVSEGTPCDLLVPGATFKRASTRNQALRTIRSAFEKKLFETDIRQDRSGWFFILRFPTAQQWVLIGTGRFESAFEAESAARLTAFLGAWEQNQIKSGYDTFSFEIVSRPIEYARFLQEMKEDNQAYLRRREVFLDHLLARFSEKFTEYAALLFHLVQDEQTRRSRSVEDKSRFLSNYAEISRNRGRAFDYLQPSWDTKNISGFERRASMLAGFTDDYRRSLCNVEVYETTPPYEVVLHDWHGEKLMVSVDPIPAAVTGERVAATLHRALKSNAPFQIDYNKAHKKYVLNATAGYVRFQYPRLLETEFDAIEKGRQIGALFAQKVIPENVQITSYAFEQELIDRNEVVKKKGNRSFRSEQEAKSPTQVEIFIQSGNQSGLRYRKLKPAADSTDRYLPLDVFHDQIDLCPSRWKWHKYDQGKKSYVPSGAAFLSEKEALSDYIEKQEGQKEIFPTGKGYYWEIKVSNEIILRGAGCFSDQDKAITAWRQAKEWGTDPENFVVSETADHRFRIELQNDKGGTIAFTNNLDTLSVTGKSWSEACINALKSRQSKPGIKQVDDCWGFRILSEKGDPFLSGYCIYPSAVEALEAWMEAYSAGADAGKYTKSGDETNFNYIFLVKDRQNRFIAEIPRPSDNETERDETLRNVQKTLKKQSVPLLVKKEAPAWTFSLLDEKGRPLLKSLDEFSSIEAAREACFQLLEDTAEPGRVKVAHEILQTDQWSVRIESGNAKSVLTGISESVQAQILKLNIRQIPSGFRFYYYWDWPKGDFKPLFESAREFETREAAEKAYVEFAKHFHKGELKPRGQGNHQSWALVLPGEKTPVVYSTPQAVAQKGVIQKFMAYISTHLAEDVKDYSAWVQPTKTEPPKFGFRMVKKGQPFAVLACNPHLDDPHDNNDDFACYPSLLPSDQKSAQPCFEPTPLPQEDAFRPRRVCFASEEDAKKVYWDQCLKKPGDYTWLEICLGTTDTLLKPTGENCICKYHFIVQGRIGAGPIRKLFYSIRGYDTEVLAIEAYQQQFLEILQIASCETNYGKDKKICTKDCFSLQPDACGNIGEYLVAVAEDFDEAEQAGIVQLTEWAKSFPVRYFETWENGRKTRKYYFRLYELQTHRFEWQSWACYTTFEEAWQDFMKLLQLLGCKENCRISNVDFGCGKAGMKGRKLQVEIREILATSQSTYANADEAWGRDAACDHPVPSCSCGEQWECADNFGKNFPGQSSDSPVYIQKGSFFQSNPLSETGLTQKKIEIKDGCCKIATHPCCHLRGVFDPNSSENPEQLFREMVLQVLRSDSLSMAVILLNGYFYPILQTDQSPILPCPYFVQGTAPHKNEAEAMQAGVLLLSRLKGGNFLLKILYDEQRGGYSFELYDDCCRFGAERFLFAAQSDQAFYPFERIHSDTQHPEYGYYIVDECFKIAVHPCWYESEEEAQKVIDAYKKPLAEYFNAAPFLRDKKYFLKLQAFSHFFINQRILNCQDKYDSQEDFACAHFLTSATGFNSEQEALDFADKVYEIDRRIKSGDQRYEYRIVSASECGLYSFELVDTCCILGKNPCMFKDRYSRDRALTLTKECFMAEGMHLLEHILMRPCAEDCGPKTISKNPCPEDNKERLQPCNPCLLQGCFDGVCQLCWVDNPLEKDLCLRQSDPPVSYYPLADLYSFWATLALPSWMKRFQQKGDRKFLEHVLNKEAPAHIALNIIWLSPRQMCRFEEVYRRWLSWMQCPVNDLDCGQMPGCCQEENPVDSGGETPDNSNACNLRCCMVKCLTALRPYRWCSEEEEEKEKECGCGSLTPFVNVPPSFQPSKKPFLDIENGQIVNLFRCHRSRISRKGEEPDGGRAEEGITTTAADLPVHPKAEPSFVSIAVAVQPQAAEQSGIKAVAPATAANGNAEKRQFNNRINERKTAVSSLEGKLTDPQVYDRLAVSFLSGNGQFSEFRKHVEYLLKKTPRHFSKQDPEALLLKNAVWHLLDTAVNREAEGAPFIHEKALKDLLKLIKAKGLDLKELAVQWDKDQIVNRVFGKKQTDKFLKMLKA